MTCETAETSGRRCETHFGLPLYPDGFCESGREQAKAEIAASVKRAKSTLLSQVVTRIHTERRELFGLRQAFDYLEGRAGDYPILDVLLKNARDVAKRVADEAKVEDDENETELEESELVFDTERTSHP